jgi:hypothetical protein
VEEKLADPTVVVADTTAQEAAIPHPNEMNLMATFVSAVAAASKHVGVALSGFVKRAGSLFRTAKKKLREFRLFAKDRTKAARMKVTSAMASIVEQVQDGLERALDEASRQRLRLTKHRKIAWAKLRKLQDTMATLLPQIRYWIKTGWVAANKSAEERAHVPRAHDPVGESSLSFSSLSREKSLEEPARERQAGGRWRQGR